MAELSSASVADQVLFKLLLEFGHDPDRLKEAISKFGLSSEPSTFRPSNPLAWELGIEGDDIDDVQLDGSSKDGLFVLEGRNLAGKTFALIGMAALLGFPWEQDSVATFFRDEQRYLAPGKAFVEGFQTGTMTGSVKFDWADSSFRVSVRDGKATLTLRQGKSKRTQFSLLNDGWEPYRTTLSGLVDVEFVPQNKNFLLRLVQELSFEILARMDALLEGLEGELGDRAPSRAELEFRIGELESQLEEETRGLSLSRDELQVTVQRISELKRWIATASDKPTLDRLQQLAALVKAKVSLRDNEEAFRDAQTEARDRRTDATRATGLATKMDSAWQRLDGEWRRLKRQVDLDQFAAEIEALMTSRTIDSIQRFLETADYGGRALYVRLASEFKRLLKATGDTAVFPLRDLRLDLEARTASEAATLFESEAAWASHFARLADSLRAVLDEFPDLNPDEKELNPHAIQERAADFTNLAAEADDEREGVEEGVRQALAGLESIDVPDNSEELLQKYTEILSEVDRQIEAAVDQLPEVLAKDYQSVSEDEVVALLSGFPASAEEQIKMLELKQRTSERPVRASERRCGEIKLELGKQEKMLQDDWLLTLVDIRESLNSSILLIDENLRRRSEGHRWLPLTIPFQNREIDLTNRVPQILGEALLESCPEMFIFEDRAWTTLPVSAIDCDRWVVEATGEGRHERLFLDEDPATGTRGALTVLGLARSLRGAQVKVLCVDEWGEVHRPLSRRLAKSLRELPRAVCGFFTRPSDSVGDEITVSKFP